MKGGARWSLTGRVGLVFALAATLAASAATAAVWAGSRWEISLWSVFLLSLILSLPIGLWLIARILDPTRQVVRALSDGVLSLKDGDYSIRLAVPRDDELGELVRTYHRAVEVLRDERSAIRQRDLLLETALHRSPVATVLTDAADRVIYANPEARRLFLGGRKLEGHRFEEIADGCPTELRTALGGSGDGLFSAGEGLGAETYHLSERRFLVNRRPHRLILLRRLTSELDRQEARIWKRAIRVISHELNNSLAPISSLVHSAGVLAERPEARERLPRVFSAIDERVAHLTDFLRGYARFARLPAPVKEEVAWRPLLDKVAELYPFRLEGTPPEYGSFDAGQMEQVLINLLKNAREASPEGEEIVLRLNAAPAGGTVLEVLDRGRGMDPEVLRNALLPFYSTKTGGSGIGLPLCREILAEHGGRLAIRHREEGGVAVSAWLPEA